MSILNTAKRRYATKSFDPDRKISDAEMQTLKAIFQLSPSSINIQPWGVLITDKEAGKRQITKATQGDYIINEQKILDASHVMVLCARSDIDQKHLDRVLAQEQIDGRLPSKEVFNTTKELYSKYLAGIRATPEFINVWAANQVYIALGCLLLAAANMNIDTLTMEGYNAEILTDALKLKEKGLLPVVLVALGYHTDDDFNSHLPKSRFELEDIFLHF